MEIDQQPIFHPMSQQGFKDRLWVTGLFWGLEILVEVNGYTGTFGLWVGEWSMYNYYWFFLSTVYIQLNHNQVLSHIYWEFMPMILYYIYRDILSGSYMSRLVYNRHTLYNLLYRLYGCSMPKNNQYTLLNYSLGFFI